MSKANKFIDLSSIPKTSNGKIDWKHSIGCVLPFYYENIIGYFLIINYEKDYVTITYEDENYYINTKVLRQCQLDSILYKNNYKYKIPYHIKDEKRDMYLIDKFKRLRIRNDGHNYEEKIYKYKCNICGWDNGTIEESNIKKSGCSCCTGYTLVPEINSVAIQEPWIVNYFQGGIEEAKQYTRGSNKRIIFKCPDCGRLSKPFLISNIIKNHGFKCVCQDGFPYTEKFMMNALDQLNIEYITQYNKINAKWCGKYKYDFYLPTYDCIIETHGSQHYMKSFPGLSVEENQENDRLKYELAKNNVSKYIVIDCRYSTKQWIMNSIINSELKELDAKFLDIDFDKCNEFASSNLAKKIYTYYLNNPNQTYIEIAKKFKISDVTTSAYIKNFLPQDYVVDGSDLNKLL